LGIMVPFLQQEFKRNEKREGSETTSTVYGLLIVWEGNPLKLGEIMNPRRNEKHEDYYYRLHYFLKPESISN